MYFKCVPGTKQISRKIAEPQSKSLSVPASLLSAGWRGFFFFLTQGFDVLAGLIS